MAVMAMVVVELHGADESQRQGFAAAMDEQDWLPVPHVNTAWAAHFVNAGLELAPSLHQTAVDVVTLAARQAGVARFDAAVQVGPTAPALFAGP